MHTNRTNPPRQLGQASGHVWPFILRGPQHTNNHLAETQPLPHEQSATVPRDEAEQTA